MGWGFFEILVVFFVAFLVLKPKQLQEISGFLGKCVANWKRGQAYFHQLQRESLTQLELHYNQERAKQADLLQEEKTILKE